jgi:hypothetical protein
MPRCQRRLSKISILAQKVRRFRNSLGLLGMRLLDVFPNLDLLVIDCRITQRPTDAVVARLVTLTERGTVTREQVPGRWGIVDPEFRLTE